MQNQNVKFCKLIFLSLMLLVGFTSCKTVDLRTDYALENNVESDTEKGKRLLKETYLKMGYDKLAETKTYEAKSNFKWRMPWTMMPMNALPGNKNKDIHFKFTTNTFDGNVEYLEGRKEGKTYGLQSWETYVQNESGTLKQKKKTRHNWGLATYHYVVEAPMRLLGADIIRYAGEREFDGKAYDLVYATWGEDAPHKEHDQWLVYINKETGMTDLTEITINDFFLPMPPGMKGATIQTERALTSNGSYLPSLVTIQLGKPKELEKHVYTFNFTDYQFDSFSANELSPLVGVEMVGDAKKN